MSSTTGKESVLRPWEAYAHGAALVLLDGIGLGAGLSPLSVRRLRKACAKVLIKQVRARGGSNDVMCVVHDLSVQLGVNRCIGSGWVSCGTSAIIGALVAKFGFACFDAWFFFTGVQEWEDAQPSGPPGTLHATSKVRRFRVPLIRSREPSS